jgi:SAM-dependent methyltransferase
MDTSDTPTDWQRGYATAVDYTAGHYPTLAPEHLNYVCLLNGIEPPATDRRYDYFELGCGQGATVSVLAAANPDARFFANDFMPSHVATARRTAHQAGLNNLTILEHSFEQLARGEPELPEFDYITMQGVYTWVSADVRREIVRFIARRLKPGGVVCLGYNAMPGWAASTPAHRWMMASAQWSVGRAESMAPQAIASLQRLSDVGAEVFVDNPAMTRRLAQIAGGDPNYIHHEYMNRGWAPAYHADVADDLAAAKLEYAGSALLPWHWMSFPAEQQALLDDIPDPRWRETAKDYLLGSSFRTDVFVKGRRPLAPRRRHELLDRYRVALRVPADQAFERMARDRTADVDSLRGIVDLLAAGTFGPAGFSSTDGSQVEFAQLTHNVAGMLSMHRHALFFGVPADAASAGSALAWNRYVAAAAADGGALRVLASPVTGGGLDVDEAGLAVYHLLSNRAGHACGSPADAALRALAARGVPDTAALRARIQQALDFDAPLWQRLGAI